MAKLRIVIGLDNSAFEPQAGAEIARILRELAEKFEAGSDGGRGNRVIRDINGNRVGRAEFVED